ncbi:hypothetical protein LP420_06250 [Massilia sp. B-10]|nr:hypothetical protein LP420_06250 [Massilia sp. B-10]
MHDHRILEASFFPQTEEIKHERTGLEVIGLTCDTGGAEVLQGLGQQFLVLGGKTVQVDALPFSAQLSIEQLKHADLLALPPDRQCECVQGNETGLVVIGRYVTYVFLQLIVVYEGVLHPAFADNRPNLDDPHFDNGRCSARTLIENGNESKAARSVRLARQVCEHGDIQGRRLGTDGFSQILDQGLQLLL